MIHDKLQIFQVKLPLPFRLNHVNCYAVKGRQGWTLVDAGLNNQATQEGWQEFFREKSITSQDVKAIFLTHFHPDHYGAAGWLQQQTGAPIYISSIDANRVNSYWKNSEQTLGTLSSLFLNHGMPQPVVSGVIEAMNKLIPLTAPHGSVSTLEAGQIVEIGDHPYKILHTPGHTDGHFCYYNEEHGLMFSGDHLLPKISSNISLWPQPGVDKDPLDNFLNSLKKIDRLDCQTVLPSHGSVFDTMHQRVQQLLAHHTERLEAIKLAVGEENSGYKVCRMVFSQDLSMHELRFAMAETLAHLMYLVYRNQLVLTNRNGTYVFKSILKENL